MIERAVASLEAGRLQRAIPKSQRATRRPHRLHTAFWNHNAAALELSSLWPPSSSEQPPSDRVAATAKSAASELLEPKLVATSFLLDFLYPNETKSLLHRMLAPRPRSEPLRPLRRRQYSAQHMASFQRSEPSTLRTAQYKGISRTPPEIPTQYQSIATATTEAIVLEPAQESVSVQTTTDTTPAKPKSPPEAPSKKFGSRAAGTGRALVDAWNSYQKASREEQQARRPSLIIALARTNGYLECSRAAALFSELPRIGWTDELLCAAIRSLSARGKFTSALNKFKDGLQDRYVSGMQYIVASAVTARNWSELLRVWFEYAKFIRRYADQAIPFDYLQSVPNLDMHFAAFENHVKYTGLAQIRVENKKFYSRQRFDQLRHLMIRYVLAKPCKPSNAMDILSRYNNTAYYQLYIRAILRSAKIGKQSRSSLRHLSKIYEQYRLRPDAKLTPEILRGMFKIYEPTNPAGLALLFQDWRKSKGGKDKWAYENFLRFYAHSGDVAAARDLWRRYVTAFPESRKEARGFYSLLDAYAQAGDGTGAENEISAMKKSGVQPDKVIENALLKSHIRAGNLKTAADCFDAIIERHGPNTQAFEHMMGLHSANGYLEQTLRLFNQAQTAGIQPSKSMAMSLVAAYLHNDLIQEAEKICREMALRGITSREVWNSLIRAYANAGKLGRGFQLLAGMQNNNLAWDEGTCEAVLIAQGRAKETASAHRLLRSAVADSMLSITADHFAIVMNSAIGTRQAPLVDILTTEMERAGIQPNFATHLARFESGFVRAPTADRTARLARELVQYMRKLTHNTDAPLRERKPDPYTIAVRDVTELKRELRDIGDALKLLIDKREMALAEDLVTLYARMRPVSQQGDQMPSNVLSVIMGAYLDDGRHDRVLQLWAVILKDIRRRAENPATKSIFPVYAYHLSAPMAHVAKVYRAAGDGKRLLAYTQAALDAGFKFTRDTWNTLICCLAELGQWEAAMHWCETLLMPRWRGWNPRRGALPLAERHELTDARVLVASRPAVLSLQREWLRLRKLAAWSAGVTAKLRRVETQYPLLHHAFATVDVADLPGAGAEESRPERRPSINKAILRDTLAAMPLQDLLAMRLSLGAQLNASRERRGRAWAAKWGRVYVPPRSKRRRF